MGIDRRLSLLFEEVSSGYTSIEQDKANNLIKSSANRYRTAQALYTFAPKDDVEESDYLEVNTPQKESTYKGNYHEIFMDSLKRWQSFPKRGKSVVAYSDKDKEMNDDGVDKVPYVMIPYDDTIVGVCPKGDITESFPNVAINLGIKFENFNEGLNLLLNIFNNPQGTIDQTTKKLVKNELQSYDTNYEVFREALDKVDNEFFTEEGSALLDEISTNPFNRETEDTVISIIQYLQAKDLKLLNAIDKLFDPSENGFKFMPFSKFEPADHKDNEAWIADPCLLVKETAFDTLTFGGEEMADPEGEEGEEEPAPEEEPTEEPAPEEVPDEQEVPDDGVDEPQPDETDAEDGDLKEPARDEEEEDEDEEEL